MYVLSFQNNSLSGVYLLFISKICKYSSKLSTFLPEDFIDLSWKTIFCHLEERRKMKIEFLKANEGQKNSHSKPSEDTKSNGCALCLAYLDSIPNMKNSRHLGSADFINDKSFLQCTLNEFEEECLKELSVITPPEALCEIFHHFLEEMVIIFLFFSFSSFFKKNIAGIFK